LKAEKNTKKSTSTDYRQSEISDTNVNAYDQKAERALLGSILKDNSYIDLVKPWIPSADVFYADMHQRIWKTMLRLNEAGEGIDIVTVHGAYRKKTTDGDDLYYITGLEGEVPTSAHAELYAKKLHEHWLRRKLIKQTRRILQLSDDNSRGVEVLLEEAHTTIGSLLNLRPSSKFDLDVLLEETIDSIYTHKNLQSTGYSSIDGLISGMTRGEITIIAGRPGNGKTTLAANIARKLTLEGKTVAMFNREMPNVEMMKKIIAMESGNLSYRSLRHGVDDNKMELDLTVDRISKGYKNLHMFDDIRDLPSTFREIKRLKPDVVIDDHVGLIEYPSHDNRDLRIKIGEVSKRYKWLAKGEDLSVILVSQLNRNVEHRIDNIPRLSDLAESGFLEQDAETAMFAHYPWVSRYDEVDKLEFNVYIVKNRYGNTGTVRMGYDGDKCTIYNSIEEARNAFK
jgi:replicative DNA helicase